MLAARLTAVPGSSAFFERGCVVYSNQSKVDLLGVDPALIESHGAVSEEVARAMAAGVRARAGADLAVAITGVAGPGGGSAEKPVGLVHIAAARRGGEVLHQASRFGDIGRAEVRLASVRAALQLISRAAGLSSP
jgi:nicotinamide-nucleotide amidase